MLQTLLAVLNLPAFLEIASMSTEQPIPLPKNYNFVNITGQTFGRLNVLEYAGKNKFGHVTWKCQCACGTICTIDSQCLRYGSVVSCGCYRDELVGSLNRTHGHSVGTSKKLYQIWKAMIDRCHNPKNKKYRIYGGRGITVCQRWLNSFEDFRDDMGPRPSDKHSLERRDGDKGYGPDNVIWADNHTQNRNMRTNNWIEYQGRTMIITDWAKETGLSVMTIFHRLKDGMTTEQALTTPVNPNHPRKGYAPRLITCNGKTQCIAAWARETGMLPTVIARRLKKGMTDEQAIMTPAKHYRKRHSSGA